MARVYDLAEADGDLVLVDRIWPRGISKDTLGGVTWLKDVAPSAQLRTWYGHEPARFTEFVLRYRAELATEAGQQALRELAGHGSAPILTLLTATRDVEHSHAAVLGEHLRQRQEPESGDPACWLTSVCPDCGRFVEAAPPTTCPRCGSEILPG